MKAKRVKIHVSEKDEIVVFQSAFKGGALWRKPGEKEVLADLDTAVAMCLLMDERARYWPSQDAGKAKAAS